MKKENNKNWNIFKFSMFLNSLKSNAFLKISKPSLKPTKSKLFSYVLLNYSVIMIIFGKPNLMKFSKINFVLFASTNSIYSSNLLELSLLTIVNKKILEKTPTMPNVFSTLVGLVNLNVMNAKSNLNKI